MKGIFIIICIGNMFGTTNAQVKPLSLEDCYTLAKQNYPLAKQQELINKSAVYSIENISKAYLPQFSINGQATYQSDVTQVPIKLPNANIPVISKDQYRLYAEVNQTIFDGGVTKVQQQSMEAKAVVEKQQLEVELYKLKERINQLFFGILLLNEQLNQVEITKKDIRSGIDKANAAIANGTALKSSVDALQAELLRVDQRTIESKATRKAFIDMLGLFIHQSLDESVVLIKPPMSMMSKNINRPELLLFSEQQKLIDIQGKTIKAKNLPKIGLFLQGGYGRPALNMLKDDFELYYLGGIRMSWPLTGLYTSNKEKAVLDINRKSIDLQKETFLFNTAIMMKQEASNINKLEELLRSDDEIITLRTRIKNTASSQLEFGVINTNDYLREVNAEDQARQSQSYHTIQLLKAQYNQLTISGN